ncbi:MAG: cell division protein FtsL [Alphaproteobacteria bacterium]
MKFRLRNIFLILCVLGTGALLLHTSQKVQIAESKLKTIEEQITHEEESIRVLRTEWAFLNTPERLERLAQRYLDLEPVVADQLTLSPANYFQSPAQAALAEEIATAGKPAEESEVMPAVVIAPAPPQKDFDQLLQQISAELPQ